MKNRYDDAVFAFKRRMLELAAKHQSKVDDINAYDLNTEPGLRKLYTELKKVANEDVLIEETYLRMYDNITAVQENPDVVNLKEVKWFVSKNLHNMFVVQELYHAIIYYYRYYAKYNCKNERLEDAIKDWKNMVYQKPTLKELIFNTFIKSMQK